MTQDLRRALVLKRRPEGCRDTVVEGLENAPAALADVLRGGNFGKMLVRVGADRT